MFSFRVFGVRYHIDIYHLFGASLLWWEVWVCAHFFAYGYLLHLCHKSVVHVCKSTSQLSSLFRCSVLCIYMYFRQFHTVLITLASQRVLRSGSAALLTCFLVVLALSDPFHLYMGFGICHFVQIKSPGLIIGSTLNLQVNWGSVFF